MAEEPSGLYRQTNAFLIVAILALAVFPLLLALRRVDNNTLTSWQWAAAAADPAKVFLIHTAGVAAAFFLSRFSVNERLSSLLLFILTALTAVLFWPLPELVMDASRYFTQAKHLEVHGVRFFLDEWGREIDAWTDMPLMSFVYGILFRYLGESRLFIQILNTLLFSLTVLITFHAGKTLWNRDAGFFAALFLLGMPYLFTQVPLMLTDVPAMFLVTLSLLSSLLAVHRGGLWLLAPALPVVLTALVKFSTWPVLAAGLPLVALAAAPREGLRPAIQRSVSLTVIPGILLAAFLHWKRAVILGQIALLTGFQWHGLSWWQESYLSTFLFQIHPFVTVLALLAVPLSLKRRDATILLPLGIIAVLIAMKGERARYLLLVFPMVSMLAGYGLEAIRFTRLRMFAAACVVLSSLTVSVFFYRPFLMRVSLGNLKEGAELLESRGVAFADIYTLPPHSSLVNPAVAVPLFDLFYAGKIAYDPDAHASPPEGDVRKSPFRFSWRYRNPAYYSQDAFIEDGRRAVVVISGASYPALPPELAERVRLYERYSFADSSGVFRFRTLLSVYLPRPVGTGRRDGKLSGF
jgi:hypothetical protein